MNKSIIYYFYFIFPFSLFFLSMSYENIFFMKINIFIDVLFLSIYIIKLYSIQKYLFPSSIFIFFYYCYSIFGKYIWVYREEYWFNEVGDPKQVALYFSLVGFILIIFSISNLNKFKLLKLNKRIIIFNDFKIGLETLMVFTFFCFIGAFLFTNSFKNLPLFSDGMDESRVALSSQGAGGRGFGFFFLLFGIVGNSIALLSLNNINKNKKGFFILLIGLNTVLLALYSGRFLPIIPFLIYVIIRFQGKILHVVSGIKYFITTIIVLFGLMFFGAKRAFGNDLNVELAFRFLVADLFPEFRMTVYANSLIDVNLSDNFIYTIISGLIPGFIFKAIGLNKFDYFQPIGGEILKVTQYDESKVLGIRCSLFGELLFTNWFILVFLVFLFLIFRKLDTSYLMLNRMSLKKYTLITIGIFIACSIPYGSIFFISIIQLTFILFIIKKWI